MIKQLELKTPMPKKDYKANAKSSPVQVKDTVIVCQKCQNKLDPKDNPHPLTVVTLSIRVLQHCL